jgi:thiol-disulfide isomerase/thioredoxin
VFARIALAAVVVTAVVAVAVARRVSSDEVVGASGPPADVELPVLLPSAPPVQSGKWLNSPPLSPADLDGKVVLYDFWTFGCVNCKHTLPYVKAWYARYAADGLVVLSIHTPEFAYEADPANVSQFVASEGITFPVALDADKVTWRSFGNHYWPAFYLHDREGRRRYVHVGEGSYEVTENAIRALLGVDLASPRAEAP